MPPAAIAPIDEPSRMPMPVSGSTVPTVCRSAIVIGADHVAPLSVERMTRKRRGRAAVDVGSSEKNRISVPSGSTTMMLLIVWRFAPGS